MEGDDGVETVELLGIDPETIEEDTAVEFGTGTGPRVTTRSMTAARSADLGTGGGSTTTPTTPGGGTSTTPSLSGRRSRARGGHGTGAGGGPFMGPTIPTTTTGLGGLSVIDVSARTKRGSTAIANVGVLYHQNALETYYQKKDEKDTQRWVAEVTKGLTEKFSLVRAESINADQLETVYDLTLRIHELTTMVMRRGMGQVFDIYGPRQGTMIWEKKGNLLENFTLFKPEQVQQSVRFIKEYGDEHLIWGMTLTFQLIEDSCASELRQRVSEHLLSVPDIEQGGPTYFALAMSHVASSNYAASVSLMDKINNIRIRDYPGNDVEKIVGFLRGALKRLENCNQTPPDLIMRLLKIFQTAENYKFNNFFAMWYSQLVTTLELDNTKSTLEELVTAEQILNVANRQYTTMIQDGTWLIQKKKHQSNHQKQNNFSNKNVTNETETKSEDKPKAHLQRNDETRTNGRRGKTPKYLQPPKEGEPDERMYKGKPEYWCKKCNKWVRHPTKDHVENFKPNNDNKGKQNNNKTVQFEKANSSSVKSILRNKYTYKA